MTWIKHIKNNSEILDIALDLDFAGVDSTNPVSVLTLYR